MLFNVQLSCIICALDFRILRVFFLFVRVFIIWYQIMCTLFVKRFGCHKNFIYQTMQQFCATTIQATMSQSYLNFAHTFHTQMPTLMSFTMYTSSTCRQRRQVIMEFKFVKIYLVFHFSNSFEKKTEQTKMLHTNALDMSVVQMQFRYLTRTYCLILLTFAYSQRDFFCHFLVLLLLVSSLILSTSNINCMHWSLFIAHSFIRAQVLDLNF